MELDFVSWGTDWTLTSFRLESDVCLRKFPLQQGRETRAGIVPKFRQEASVYAYLEKWPHSGHMEKWKPRTWWWMGRGGRGQCEGHPCIPRPSTAPGTQTLSKYLPNGWRAKSSVFETTVQDLLLVLSLPAV